MQVVFENKHERNDSGRIGIVGVDICTRRSSWYLERKYNERFENRNIGVWDSRGAFRENKERVWKKLKKESKSQRK